MNWDLYENKYYYVTAQKEAKKNKMTYEYGEESHNKNNKMITN